MSDRFCQTAVASNTQFGKQGPRVKATSGVFQVRNATDSAFVRLAGDDPTTDDDFVTRRWALANLGTATGREAGLPNPAIYYIDPANTSSTSLAPGATSGTITDLEGNGSAGALNTPASYSEGAFNFNGTSGSVTFTKNTTLDDLFTTTKPATVIAFIKPTTAGESSAGRIVSTQGSGGANNGWWLRLGTPVSNAVVLRFVRAFATTNGDWDTDIACVPFNAWSSVAVSWNGTALPGFYLNGIQANVTAITSPSGAAQSDSGTSLVVGNSIDDNATFNGQIGAILTFDRVLTQAEIQQITNLFLPRLTRSGSVPGTIRQDKVTGSGTVAQNILANRDFQKATIDASGGANINLQVQAAAGRGIQANSDYSTISGGRDHLLSGDHSFIGGGDDNDIGSTSASTGSTIAGGRQNTLQTGFDNTIGGGAANLVAPPSGSVSFVTIGGGQGNKIYGPATHATISGGEDNEISSSSGGTAHWSNISGGQQNKVIGQHSHIGGGLNNDIGVTAFSQASFSTIAGGELNRIDGDYCFAFGRRSRITSTAFNGCWISSDDNNQDDDIDRTRQHKLRYEGGFTRRTTTGFSEESWERFNAHVTLSGVSASQAVVLGTLGTNTRTLDVSNLRVHGIRTNSTAGVADTFASQGGFTGRRRNDGNQSIFVQSLTAGSEGTGVGVTAVLQVTGNNYEVLLTLPAVQPTTENWQFALRWERQIGGATA